MQSRNRNLRCLSGVLAATTALTAIALMSAPAVAADPPQASAQTQEQPEEIIVTARKRSESLLNVPVQEAVITQARIESQGLLSTNQIVSQVPGLVMGNSTSGFGQQVVIRGIGNAVQSSSIDQDVSLNIDGVQVNQGLAYNAGLFDVEQVEVLKGPQALFFGKNSPGGVISLRSADPGDDFEMMARVGYEFEALQKHVEGYISGPVTDTLGLRLAVSYNDQQGFFYNTANPSVLAAGYPGGLDPSHSRTTPQQDLIIRGTALWKPSGKLTVRLKANWAPSRRQGDGGVYELIGCPAGVVSPTGIPFEAGADCKVDRNLPAPALNPAAFPGIANNGQPFANSDQGFGSLEVNYDLTPTLSVTSVTGFYTLLHSHLYDGSNAASVPTLADYEKVHRRDWTQEVRISSSFDGPLNFVTGAYYQNGYVKDATQLMATQAFLSLVPLPPYLENGWSSIDISSVSAFGQLRYDILSNLELTAGARWTDEQRSHTTFADFNVEGALVLTPQYLDLAVPKIESRNVSPEVNLTYHPSENTTLYASYKEGFKSGSFNTGPGYDLTGQNFGDETNYAEEAGFKGLFLDRRLSVDLAGYHYLYKNMQLDAAEDHPGMPFTFQVVNAASAEVFGADLSVSYRPEMIDGLTLNASGNYNHGRFGTFTNAPCYPSQTFAQGCNLGYDPINADYNAQNLSGKPLIRSPELTGTLGFDYEGHVFDKYMLSFGSNVYYSSKFITIASEAPGNYQGAYAKLNANVALLTPDDQWEFALIGNNLTNKIIETDSGVADVVNGLLGFAPQKAVETLGRVEPGREIWLRLTWRYDQGAN